MQRSGKDKHRLQLIDLARGLALLAMAIYHFAWDLEFFGYAPPGLTAVGGWKLFARCIASSFLFLVGVSLFLAHSRGISWPPFLRRLAMVAGAAAAISLATWIAVPNDFIFFGILHQIALASLLGLAFLHVPAPLTLVAAAAVMAAPAYLRSAAFDHPALWWIGLSSSNPHSNDYVPLFPWFAAVLAGVAAARMAAGAGLFERMRGIDPGRWSAPLQYAGRHSLAVYLLHQPVLIGLVGLWSLFSPPMETPRDVQFTRACAAQCEQTRDAAFCVAYCDCVLGELVAENRFDEVFEGVPDTETSQRLQQIVSECSFGGETFAPAEEAR